MSPWVLVASGAWHPAGLAALGQYRVGQPAPLLEPTPDRVAPRRPARIGPGKNQLVSSETTLRLGISSCLLGHEVRFDCGHKRSGFLTDVLGRFVEWVPVCPEVELGMGVPRETVRLVRSGDDVRMVAEKSGADWTGRMRRYARARVRALLKLDLAGYVLKKDSPSCGMERVRVYDPKGMPGKTGRGLFAAELVAAFPHLPVEDEGRLHDPVLRENFIERIFAYRRLQDLFQGRWTRGQVVAFHTAHDYDRATSSIRSTSAPPSQDPRPMAR